MNQEQHNIETTVSTKPWLWKVLKVLGIFLALLLILFFLTTVLLQYKPVQNYLIKKVTTYLSKELETTVEVEKLEIDFFDKLILEDFYVEDFHGDTLIYSQALSVNFSTSLRNILNKNISVTDLTLDRPQFRLSRYEGEADDQFNQLLAKLSNKPSTEDKSTNVKSAGTPLFLDVKTVYLNQAVFIKGDSVGGEEIKVLLERGVLYVDSLNLAEKIVRVRKTVLTKPYVTLINFPKKPLPIDSTEVVIQEEETLSVEEDSLKKKWKIFSKELDLTDGYFEHHNYGNSPVKLTSDKEIDYDHLIVSDIEIQLADFEIYDWVFIAESKKLSLKESSGFVINNLTAKRGRIAPDKVELKGADLITPYSHLKDSLVFKFKKYPDFRDFPDKVYIEGYFDNAYVAVRDIMHFAPKLKKNALFAQNSNEILYIDGLLKGRVNSLKGRDLNLRLGNLVRLKGNFSSRDLTEPKETSLIMNLDYLRTSMATLRLLVPNLSLPINFDKLGNLDFQGRFIGFYSDFVADGYLKTDLGDARMDLKVDVKQGRELASYRGGLDLIQFDLGKWTDNKELGLITFKSKVENGVGLSKETVNANLEAFIPNFTYKGYTYKNISMNGKLNRNNFSGDFAIKDDNIDFNFVGSIADLDALPDYKFEAKVNHLDLKELKFIEKDYVLSGDIGLNLRGKNLDDLQGFAELQQVNVIRNKIELYKVDSLKATYATRQDRKKSWLFDSELFTARLVGDFNLAKTGEAVLQFLEKNYTGVAKRFNIHSKGDTSFVNNQFELDLKIIDTKNFTDLIDKKLDTIRNAHLKVNFDYAQDSFDVDLELPSFKYDNVVLNGITLKSDGLQKQSELVFNVDSTNINDAFKLGFFTLESRIDNDSARFLVNTKDLSKEIDRLNLKGDFSLAGDLFNFRFLPADLIILNEEWTIEEDNYLQIGKNFIKTNNFELYKGDRRVALSSLLDKGIVLEVDGFNINYINTIWSYKNLQFDGVYHINATIADLFKMEGLALNANIDTFLINEDLFGKFTLTGTSDSIGSPIKLTAATLNGVQQMIANGIYNPPNTKAIGSAVQNQPNYLDVNFFIQEYPLNIAEYFVPSGVTNTVGKVSGDISFKGLLPKPDMNGTLRVLEGATTIDYIGTRYFIPDETIRMTNDYLFDASGGKITDEYGNVAYVTGGITHQFFNKLGLDVHVKADHFQVINTTKADNEVYYGEAIAKGDIDFTGDFNQTNIDIAGTTVKGTKIYIPVTSGSAVEETSFIRFEHKKDTVSTEENAADKKKTEIKGVKLHMEIDMTNAAEVQLIFDEKAGDIMKGIGFGDVKIDMTRQGDISMYGHYEIEEGEYLFTLFNLVNKPFSVKRGGTIDWLGEPYNAIINIEAEYTGLHAPPYNFISEYVVDGDIKTEAQKSTDVGLTMRLTERLMKPDIAFDLNFPNLTGEIKNYTDSKIRSIRLDQNELNRQVFGLIVIGGFLPSDQGGLQGRELLTGINTLSELLSSQLSIHLTEFFSSAVSSDFLSLEDFDVAYNVYEASITDLNNLGTGHEVHLGQRFRIKDRLVINTAWGFDLGSEYTGASGGGEASPALVTGDFIIEYELTKDKRLKIRGYYKNEPEILFGGRKNNAGLGLSFRREFDRLDFLSFLKKSAKRKK